MQSTGLTTARVPLLGVAERVMVDRCAVDPFCEETKRVLSARRGTLWWPFGRGLPYAPVDLIIRLSKLILA